MVTLSGRKRLCLIRTGGHAAIAAIQYQTRNLPRRFHGWRRRFNF